MSIKENITKNRFRLILTASGTYGHNNVWSSSENIFVKNKDTIKQIQIFHDDNLF